MELQDSPDFGVAELRIGVRLRIRTTLDRALRDVCRRSDLAVPITPGEGPQPNVKLKQTARKPTFGAALPVLEVLRPWLAPAR